MSYKTGVKLGNLINSCIYKEHKSREERKACNEARKFQNAYSILYGVDAYNRLTEEQKQERRFDI